jgi:hypothetical protein
MGNKRNNAIIELFKKTNLLALGEMVSARGLGFSNKKQQWVITSEVIEIFKDIPNDIINE